MAMHKKAFTVDVNNEISDAFSAQVDQRGYTKYRAIEGALRAFMALPPELQVQLMSNEIKDVAKFITEHLLDAQTLKFLASLSPEDKHSVLETVRKTRAKVSENK